MLGTTARVKLMVLIRSSLSEGEHSWQPGPDEYHQFLELKVEYGGVKQRWIIVYSDKKAKTEESTLIKKVSKAKEKADAALRRLMKKEFNCPEDAEAALKSFEDSLKYHRVERLSLVELPRYSTPGRPRKGQDPDQVRWRVEAELSEDQGAMNAARSKHGLYVIATNVLDVEKLSASEAIATYKAQGVTVERGFRFLKDPAFFADSLFLKKPSRLMALMMVMTLSLLVYAVAEFQMREKMRENEATIPSQTGKPTGAPTLRRVFQIFEGIEVLLIISETILQSQVLNLTEVHQKILTFLSSEVRLIYLGREECGVRAVGWLTMISSTLLDK